MTRDEAIRGYRSRQHKPTCQRDLKFSSPFWRVVIAVLRVLLFPVFFLVRVFRWTYHMEN